MKKKMIQKCTAMVLFLLLLVGIFGAGVLAYDIPEFKNISDKGCFVLSKDGVKPEFSDGDEILKLEWYTDALCPDCCRAHEFTKGFVEEKMAEGLLEIKYFPLNFLPQYSENNYPLHAAAWILGIAEYAPDSVAQFMDLLYVYGEEKEVRKAHLNDEFIEKCAKDAGVEDEAFAQIKDEMYFFEATVNGASVGIRQNKELIEKSPLERVFVPFIYSDLLSKALEGETEEAENLLGPLNDLIESLEPCGAGDEEEGC